MKKLYFISICLFLATLSVKANNNEKLIEACRQMDVQQVKALIANGADVNALDESGKSILANAFFSAEITKLLLDKGADPNKGNYPPIINAANNYSVAVMDLLLNAGADPNLHGMVKNEATDQIAKMISDMETNVANAKGKTKKIYEEGLAKLKATYPDVGKGLKAYAINATVQATNCIPCLDKLLKAGSKLNLVESPSLTHLYASYGQSAAQRQDLFTKGKSIMEGFGFKVPEWYTALPESANGETEEMLKLLLKAGEDVNVTDAQGKTPLHNALAGGVGNKKEVLLALLNNGADINIEDPVFGKCFTLAAKTGLVEVAEKMLELGADISETSKIYDVQQGQNLKGATPIIAATMHNHLGMVKFLISKGVSIKEDAEGFSYNMYTGCATGVKNKSAIYFAIDNNNMEIVKFLVEESGLNWYRPLKVNQLKQSSSQQVGNLKVTTTKCYSDGSYKPSAYAKKIGLKDFASYLKEHQL
jgi:ankyrin repeat protein